MTPQDVPETAEVTPTISPVAEEKIGIVYQPIFEAVAGEPLVLRAGLTGPAEGKLVSIMYRKMGQDDFRSSSMNGLGDLAFEGRIPARAVTPEGLEYYLRIVDTVGNELSRYPEDGSFLSVVPSPAEVPEEVAIPEPELTEETPAVEAPAEPAPAPVAEEKPAIIMEEPPKTGLQRWHWMGLGAVALVGIAVVAFSGGGDDGGNGRPTDTKLPDPPDRP
jgi:hypothetical protein